MGGDITRLGRIDQAQFSRIHSQLFRRHVQNALIGKMNLGITKAAETSGGNFIGIDQPGFGSYILDAI